MTKQAAAGAEPFVPARGGLPALRDAAAQCRGCDLYRDTTQTVFGAGPVPARVMMIGEQPGDREDLAGKPFVGPAGHLLDRLLAEAGIDRDTVYLTNAVKHFSFHMDDGGKRRIHQTPRRGQIVACRPWLAAEFLVVRPELVVCLGAVAAKALLGNDFKLTEHRGELLDRPRADDLPGDWHVTVTVHPSAVLRAQDREDAYRAALEDLRCAARRLA